MTAPCLSRRDALATGVALALPTALAARTRSPLEVAIVGDSIAAGLGLPPDLALPAQLERALRRCGVEARVRAEAAIGATTGYALARLVGAVRARTDLALVELGGNDLIAGIDPQRMAANLEAIADRLRRAGARVLIAGVAAPAGVGPAYARAFDAAFARAARASGAALYPDLLAGVRFRAGLEQRDGLHPNAAGVRVIATRLAAALAHMARRA